MMNNKQKKTINKETQLFCLFQEREFSTLVRNGHFQPADDNALMLTTNKKQEHKHKHKQKQKQHLFNDMKN